MKNFIDSLDEWLYNKMGLMGGCCSSIDSLKYTTARTAVEKLLKEIQKEKEIKSFDTPEDYERARKEFSYKTKVHS